MTVNRLNKSESFKHMRMISFDLRTATFTYAPGYTASITYTPQDDSYRILFDAEGVSPHEIMAGLLSHRLNELASGPKSLVKGSTGEQFLGVSVLIHDDKHIGLISSCCAILCRSCKRLKKSELALAKFRFSSFPRLQTSDSFGMFKTPTGAFDQGYP